MNEDQACEAAPVGRNPFIMPLFLALPVALIGMWAVDVPFHTLWGMLAWGPWLIVLTALLRWERRHPVSATSSASDREQEPRG